MGCIAAARRGIIIVGQVPRAEQAAAALKIAEALGWPLVADVLSGMMFHLHPPCVELVQIDMVAAELVSGLEGVCV